MDARQELAKRISALCPSLHTEQVDGILQDYQIIKALENGPSDILTHVEHFLSAKKVEGLSDKTLSNYRIYLTHFAEFACKDAANISTDDVRGFLSSQHVKENSLQTILNILRSFFAWMSTEEAIPRNPMLKIKTPRRHKIAIRKSLSEEELERLRNTCVTPRERALVEFMYSTGCRVSEITGLKLTAVDFSRRCACVLGKGGKERKVYFSIKAKLLLEEYLHNRLGASDGLFINTRAPFTAMSSRSMQKLLYALGRRASLPERVHPHLLRHTFATLSLNRGMDITMIQQLLGHAQLSTTEIYAQVDPERLRQAYDRIVA